MVFRGDEPVEKSSRKTNKKKKKEKEKEEKYKLKNNYLYYIR